MQPSGDSEQRAGDNTAADALRTPIPRRGPAGAPNTAPAGDGQARLDNREGSDATYTDASKRHGIRLVGDWMSGWLAGNAATEGSPASPDHVGPAPLAHTVASPVTEAKALRAAAPGAKNLENILVKLGEYYRVQRPHELTNYFTKRQLNDPLAPVLEQAEPMFTAGEFRQLYEFIGGIPDTIDTPLEEGVSRDSGIAIRNRLQAALFGVLLGLVGSNMLKSNGRLTADRDLKTLLVDIVNNTDLNDLGWVMRLSWDSSMCAAVLFHSERSFLEILGLLLPMILRELCESIFVFFAVTISSDLVAIFVPIFYVVAVLLSPFSLLTSGNFWLWHDTNALKTTAKNIATSVPWFALGATVQLPMFALMALPFMLFDAVSMCFGKDIHFGFHRDLVQWLHWAVTNRYPVIAMALEAISIASLLVGCLAMLSTPLAALVVLPVALTLASWLVASFYNTINYRADAPTVTKDSENPWDCGLTTPFLMMVQADASGNGVEINVEEVDGGRVAGDDNSSEGEDDAPAQTVDTSKKFWQKAHYHFEGGEAGGRMVGRLLSDIFCSSSCCHATLPSAAEDAKVVVMVTANP